MDVATLKSRIHIEDLLKELGVAYKKAGSDEFLIRCRSGLHPDKNPSLRVKVDPGGKRNGLMYCFSCGWGGDVITLTQKVKKLTFIESLDFIRKVARQEIQPEKEEELNYERTFGSFEPKEVKIPIGLFKITPSSECFQYLRDRGIGELEIDRYELRDLKWRQRVFVPLSRFGAIISWLARSYRGVEPKVITPRSEQGWHHWAFFGYDLLDRENTTLHLTEGWVSCIRLVQSGFRNAIATCGSKLTAEQVMDILWAKKVIVWKEGDSASDKLVCDVVGWMGRGREIQIVEMPEKTDPADFNRGDLVKLFKERKVAHV